MKTYASEMTAARNIEHQSEVTRPTIRLGDPMGTSSEAGLDRMKALHCAQTLADGSPRIKQFQQLQDMANGKAKSTPSNGGRETLEMLSPGGLPMRLKSGIESMSGLSMDHVRVHYNSAKSAQLGAHAYAQGNQIHLGPGQERHLPHEAWHVVQQAQGRVRATAQMHAGAAINDDAELEHEADVMGDRAMLAEGEPKRLYADTGPGSASGVVIQGVFNFRVKPNDYTITKTRYSRTFGKYMNGNSEHKHVTADAVKDALWTGLEGLRIDEFASRLLDIVDAYMALPGVDLSRAHVLDETDDDSDADEANIRGDEDGNDRINGPMRTNYAEFEDVHTRLTREASKLSAWKSKFLEGVDAGSKEKKDAAAFNMQKLALDLIDSLDKFRDLMPLVNVISGLQKRGKEKEAKNFLKTGVAQGGIDSTDKALWAFFDFAAIDQLDGEEGIVDSIPWLDIAKLKTAVSGNTNKSIDAVTTDDMINALAGIMLANHIKLTTLSYPTQAQAANFGTEANVLAALNRYASAVDRATVAKYASGTWDWFKEAA